jgi:uncharacterized membrane protein required for colicin V production
MEFFQKLNWVDFCVVALAVRIVYMGYLSGFVIEFMKAIGTVGALFAAFHYYERLAGMVARWVPVSVAILETIMFVGLWALVFLAFKLLRDGLLKLFKVDTTAVIDKWCAMAVAAGRFVLSASMFLFILLVTDVPYFEKMTVASVTQRYVVPVAPKLYIGITDGFLKKFFPDMHVDPAFNREMTEDQKL